MKIELKSCPFCGAKAFMWKTNHHTYIQCDNSSPPDTEGHFVQVSERTEEEAVKKWNRRV
jgi:hypothetical protein